MKLVSLLEKLEYTCLQGSTDQEVKNVIYDSRKVEEGSLFICIRGAVVDGHKFVPDVVAKGAKVLIVEEAVEAPEDVTVILVKDTRYAMAFISAAYFGHPAKELKTIGITGTKGKTTTTYMVKSILENAGYKVGLIGTIETIIGDTVIPSANTTPESLLVQKLPYPVDSELSEQRWPLPSGCPSFQYPAKQTHDPKSVLLAFPV